MLYRKARFSDTETIYNLIAVYAKNGEMLARSRNTLYENLRDFVVAEDEDGEVIGFLAGYFVNYINIIRENGIKRIKQ